MTPPVIPRGDTSGRHDPLLAPIFWEDAVQTWRNGDTGVYRIEFCEGSQWATSDSGEWVCIRGPR